ncbi:hypothetical protein DEO72_LG5g2462 [Vigna unguiculata]|uniref:Ulp1 protease family n=1 Tax=Vigna unguiculata TaxID=3917 RepID=A0A4D6LZG6_VIGUN|nr:hypothetical protein DEO72_LG5g2462 [Vigna unguiculata]
MSKLTCTKIFPLLLFLLSYNTYGLLCCFYGRDKHKERSKREIYDYGHLARKLTFRCSSQHYIIIVGKPRGQQLKVIYPKCNKQEDSWECGYYVMSWIRTIIRAAIKDEWIERFKNPSPLPDDIIHTLRQEWAAYLLERWS